ncbi:hypothetical protein [Neobacillus ginsengisoli]|uniref:Uncharacterized protein n=1 Tax=Neobacillus ginsengisoli TaxID=904295 RepID=A0ABT9XZW2_9BACI|nr:hypothetical protein [Neobacillus ginsengisoli]MDQ0200429.1 hypothetical protein [Neobacillus ginsengisoli]
MSQNKQLSSSQLDFQNNEGKIEISNSMKEINVDGSYNRQKNRFTTPFGNHEGELPVDAGRYR